LAWNALQGSRNAGFQDIARDPGIHLPSNALRRSYRFNIGFENYKMKDLTVA
jgi:hypothetical protein